MTPRIRQTEFPTGDLTGPFRWLDAVDGFAQDRMQVEYRVDAQLGGAHLKPLWVEKTAPFQYGGDPSGVFDPGPLTEGQHSFGVVLREIATGRNLSNIRVYRNVVHSPVPPPPAGDPGTPDRSLGAWLGSLPIGMTVKEIRTLSEWQQAWPVGNGQLLHVIGSLRLPALRSTKRYTDWAALQFDPGVTFGDGWYLEGDKLATFGGVIPMATQHGLHATNIDHMLVWNLLSGGCGATGALVHANVGPVGAGFSLDFKVTRCGQNPGVYDPHGDPGTGVHPWYLGSDDYGHGGVQGTYVMTGYACPTGAGQLGNALHNATLWLAGDHFDKVAKSQVAGNLIQLWGGGCHDLLIKRAIGKDLAGRMLETDGMSSSARNIVIEYARGTGIRLSDPVYATKGGLVKLGDCLPLP